MRTTGKCPECAGQKFVVVREFRQPDHDSSNLTAVLPALTVTVAGSWVSDRKSFGHFEAWTCAACGLTQLYATGLPRDVSSLATQYPDQVRIVDATPKDGPYR